MSRPSDYLNGLPTELIVKVLDYLNLKDVLEASTVCVRWYEILSANRYLACSRLRLEPALLDQEIYTELGQYRSIAIRSAHFTETKDQRKLQQYLFNSDAVEILEELEIMLEVPIWNDVFGAENVLKLPNLHTLHISVPMVTNMAEMHCRIVAPNLKTNYQDSNTINGPLDLFNEQIEKLVVDFPQSGRFFSNFFDLPFVNLRSLTLNEVGWSCHDKGLLLGHTAVFSRLDHLKIIQGTGLLSAHIISEAKNLRSLEIYESQINRNIFSQINQLKELNELTLLVSFDFNLREVELSLPNLIKLTMLRRFSFLRFGSVPSLTSLTIANFYFLNKDFLTAQFCVFAYQLGSLTLVDLNMNDDFSFLMYSLVNLKSLKMKNVEIKNPFGVIQLIGCLKKLEIARFTDCTIVCCSYEPDCACASCDLRLRLRVGFIKLEDDPKYKRIGVPWTGEVTDFFSALAKANIHCAIVGEGSRDGVRRNRAFDYFKCCYSVNN